MRRSLLTVALVAALSIAMTVPAAAGAAKPSATMTKPAGCDTIRYDWSHFRKAASATIRLHHNGIYQASRVSAPVAAAGSFPLPSDLAALIVAGEHYTILGNLQDASGRTMTSSGAAWWGVC
jgi:hypothetical protein